MCWSATAIRKHLGYTHIPQHNATQVNSWCAEFLNPYLNYHRPCLFPESVTDAKGKTRKRYPQHLIMTPCEKLLSLAAVSIAAERACARVSDEEIAHIAKLTRTMRECFLENRLMEYFEINQNIHRLIVDAARNEEMSRVYVGECARIKRFRYAGNHRHDRWDSAMSEHEQIVLALKARNGPLLREMVLAHHRNGWQVSRTLLAEELSGEENGVLADVVSHSRSARRTGKL